MLSTQKEKEFRMKIAIAKDVFSCNYNHNSPFFSDYTLEMLVHNYNKVEVDKETREVLILEDNVEKEIYPTIKDSIDEYFQVKDIDLEHSSCRVSKEPLLRTNATNVDHPGCLLLESDIHCNYDYRIEIERILKVSDETDDFVIAVNSLKDKKKLKEEEEEEENRDKHFEERDFLNNGVQVIPYNFDDSLGKYSV